MEKLPNIFGFELYHLINGTYFVTGEGRRIAAQKQQAVMNALRQHVPTIVQLYVVCSYAIFNSSYALPCYQFIDDSKTRKAHKLWD